MDKDDDKKGVQLGDKNQKYYKALQLSKTLKTTTNVNEGPQFGVLYHFTQYLLDVLDDDMLKGPISLTRSLDSYATEWLGDQPYFILDKDKLRTKYKIRPYKDTSDNPDYEEISQYDEMEEVIDTNVTNLSKYIIKVVLPESNEEYENALKEKGIPYEIGKPLNEADPKKGTGKKPKGSSRRLYTDENPKDTVGIKFSTRQDVVDTLNKSSFKNKSHARQSQIINLIHQRVRAALGRTKDPKKKKKLKSAFDYIKQRKEASKRKTQRLKNKKKNIKENINKEYTIYSDMDGVLVDFNKRFKRFSNGIHPTEYEQKFGKDKFWELVDGTGVRFWVGMDWMSDGKQLWDYIKSYNPTLLSSPSRADHSKMGKRIWRQRNLPSTKLILARAANKQNYADPNSILIDDRESNIDQWIKAGGIGVLHTDTASTINKLKELGL